MHMAGTLSLTLTATSNWRKAGCYEKLNAAATTECRRAGPVTTKFYTVTHQNITPDKGTRMILSFSIPKGVEIALQYTMRPKHGGNII